MNADTFILWLIIDLVAVAMIALTWYAHRRHPGRIGRASALVRSGFWLVLALVMHIGAGFS